MTDNDYISAKTAPTIVLTEPGAGGEAEPRRAFHKLSNSVGLAVLGEVLITAAISYIIIILPVLARMLTQGISDYSLAMSEFTEGESYYFWMLLASAIAALIGNTLPGIIHAVRQGCAPLDCFKSGERVRGLFGKLLVVALGLNAAWALLYTYLGELFPEIGIDQSEFALDMPSGGAELYLYVIFVCLIAPVTEEFLFRGIILRSLSKYGTLFAAVASSLLFGLLHGNLQQTPMAFAVGLVLCYAAVRTGSIKMSIVIHFIVNCSSTLVGYLYMNQSEGDMNSILTVYGVIELAALVGTGLILLGQRRRIKWLPQNPAGSHIVLPQTRTKVRARLLAFLLSIWVLVFVVYCVDNINYSLGNRAILEYLGELLLPLTNG